MLTMQQAGILILECFIAGLFARSMVAAWRRKNAFLSAFYFVIMAASCTAVLITLDTIWDHKLLDVITAKVPVMETNAIVITASIVILLMASCVYRLVKPKQKQT